MFSVVSIVAIIINQSASIFAGKFLLGSFKHIFFLFNENAGGKLKDEGDIGLVGRVEENEL